MQDSSSGTNTKSNFRLVYISVLAALAGLGAAVLAYLIYHFIGFLYNLFFYQRIGFSFVTLPRSGLPWWIILVPALGGLICGLMAKYGSPKIIGHGIPEAMEAVWSNKSKVKLRVLFLKPISAAIAIGTGAPFGVEGPIIQGGGALGSVIGQWVSTTTAERKVLLACGAAAGMAATFNTPLGAILIAIELLVFEFESRSFIAISIASLIATGVRRLLIGTGPMFKMGPVSMDFFPHLPFLIGLGIVIGIVAILFNKGYFKASRLLRRIPVNDVILPAIGGIVLGIMGLLVPRTFGVGYSVAQEILNNQLTWGLVILVMLFKAGGVYVTLGTKTSGGFLAPVFVIGAAVGSVYAHGMNALIPGISLPIPLFALAGLGTLFGVVSNATFGFTLFAIEVTGHYDALLPVLIVGVVADVITTLFMETDIMTQELANRGINISKDYEINILKRFEAIDVIDKNPATVDPNLTISKLAVLITDKQEASSADNEKKQAVVQKIKEAKNKEDSAETTVEEKTIHGGFPIINDDEEFVGLITYGDILRAFSKGKQDSTAQEIGTSSDLITGYADEKLYELIVRMSNAGIEHLPIVARDNKKKLVGIFDSKDFLATSLHEIREEQEREQGSLSHFVNFMPSLRRKDKKPL